jgi:hypothetical protein
MRLLAFVKPLSVCLLAFWIVMLTGPQLGLADVSGGSACYKCQTKGPENCHSYAAVCTGTYTFCSMTALTGPDDCGDPSQTCKDQDPSCEHTTAACAS